MFLTMRNPLFTPTVGRVIVHPDEPEAMTSPRTRGSRRPHSEARVAAVRRLVEESIMTYAEIAARTGVAPASICRWRASAKLRRRTLAARLDALADFVLSHAGPLDNHPALRPRGRKS